MSEKKRVIKTGKDRETYRLVRGEPSKAFTLTWNVNGEEHNEIYGSRLKLFKQIRQLDAVGIKYVGTLTIEMSFTAQRSV